MPIYQRSSPPNWERRRENTAKLGGPPPGDAAEGLPRLASGAPVAPKQKDGSPDKR